MAKTTRLISIDYKFPYFLLTFPFDKTDLELVRNLPVREWNKKERVWKIPHLTVKTLEILKDTYWTETAKQAYKIINDALMQLVDSKFAKAESDGKLRPYQVIGAKYISLGKKVLLGDDMGLGKTIQSIKAILDLGCKEVLVLCPATIKWKWQNEFQKHYKIESTIIHGNQTERVKQWKSAGIKIANYDLLIRDWQIMPKEYDAIIADEIIYLKNLKSQRTKLANRLKANIRIGLSGYYMEKDLLEFYGPFNWVRPDVLPSFFRFKYRYCNFGWDGKIIGYKNLDELHLLTSPFILRRTKEEVAPELPPKIYSDYPLELEGKHLDTYEAMANDYVLWLNAQTGKNWQMTGLLKTIRLRQFVEFPEIAGFNLDSPKLEWLDDIILQVDKIVIFTFFEQSVRRLVEHYKTLYFITGTVPTKKRQALVDTFNAEKKAIMISDDAGRFGIDLFGADNIVHFGFEHNPATMKQREDRLHRIGQEKPVNILSPYFKDTIDEGIRNIFLQRQKDNDDFLEGNFQMSVARLSKKDFERMVYGK